MGRINGQLVNNEKRVLGYIMLIFGALCLFGIAAFGGGNRFRRRTIYMSHDVNEDLIIVTLLIALPIIGFILIKYGLKLIEKKD